MDTVFKPLTIGDIETVRPYFSYSTTRSCDNSVGAMLMWRDYFKIGYAIIDGALVFSLDAFGGRCYLMPLGENEDIAISALKKLFENDAESIMLCSVAYTDLAVLEKYFEVSAEKEEGWSDYLYNAEDLAYYKGRKFNGQRNHVNSFKKSYPNYTFRTIDESNVKDIMSFIDSFEGDNFKDSELFEEEIVKTREVIENYGLYGFCGLALYESAEENAGILGFTVGEVINDTLFVHIEKARHEINGAYQMLASELAKRFVTDISYINREEDVGDEGLRRSKLSYHPCMLIDKYTTTISLKI